jgi:hypothetical protein
MSAKHGATFGAAFVGVCGGVLAAGLAQYLSGDGHYLPLVVGAFSGATIAGLSAAVITHNNLGESIPQHPPEDHEKD